MKNKQLLSMRMVERGDEIYVVDAGDHVIARFSADDRQYAEAFILLPEAVILLDATLDGADGYLCETGDDSRYWEPGVLDAARRVVGRLLPWATTTGG